MTGAMWFASGALVALAAVLPLAWKRARGAAERAAAAERRAAANERMAEIGAMTGGLAHEIKNPLSTIGLNAQLLSEALRDLPLDPAADTHERDRLVRRIDTLRREADRLGDILADFLRFAGELRLDLTPGDLNAVAEQLVDFYLPQAEHHGVRLRCELAPGPLPVLVDAGHLKQAVLNLMLNATQAMSPADSLGASAGVGATAPAPPPREPPGPRELILRTDRGEAPFGRAARLHVIDTGPGIPEETLSRVFTPYFTTKPAGSGLGLPTTKRLVEEHGGRITVHSDPGAGTDFMIELPEHRP